MSRDLSLSGMTLAAAQIRHQELLKKGYKHQGVVRDWDHDGKLDRKPLDTAAEAYRQEGKEVMIIEHQFGLDMYWRDAPNAAVAVDPQP